MKIAVTGAGGFVGRALVAAARKAGVETVRLVRREPGADGTLWTLGQRLPPAAADADVLVHLASAVLGADAPEAAFDLDVEGARLLIEDVRSLRGKGRRPRFLFVSSQSADPSAANLYGRSKWAIEQLLAGPAEIVVRPGLVYGDAPESVYAVLARLAALPVVPVVAGPAAIHPIHVDDLADCLLDIARLEAPERLWQLGAAPGMTLEQALAVIARRLGRRPPVMVPVPRALVRLAARCGDLVLRPGQSLLERVDGLIVLKPMDPAPALARLGRTLRSFTPKP